LVNKGETIKLDSPNPGQLAPVNLNRLHNRW